MIGVTSFRLTLTTLPLSTLLLLCFFVRSARSEAPPINADAQKALEKFLSGLADEMPERAYFHVAPDTKKNGDPIAHDAKADYDSFLAEVKKRPADKFGAFKIGKQRTVSMTQVRIFVHFDDGDTDESLIVKVGERWYVADPIHIIR